MKVKDLIKQLQKCDPEKIVILQKDSEGNGYSPLEGIDNDSIYEEESTYSGDVWSKSWSADDAAMGEKEWEDCKKDLPDCVVLYPVN